MTRVRERIVKLEQQAGEFDSIEAMTDRWMTEERKRYYTDRGRPWQSAWAIYATNLKNQRAAKAKQGDEDGTA